MQDFYRGKRFQMQVRIQRLQRPQHVDVVVPFERWMQSAVDVNLGDAELEGFPGFLDHLWQIVFICARVSPPPIERTEIAVENADVGVIDVADENVIGDVAVLAFAHEIRHRADARRVVRSVQTRGIVLGDAPTRLDLPVDVPQLRTFYQLVHRETTSTTTAPRNTALMTAFMRKNAAFRLTGSCFLARICCTTRQPTMIASPK